MAWNYMAMFQKVRMYNDKMVVDYNCVRLLVALQNVYCRNKLMWHVVVCSLIASELSDI